MTQPPGPNPYSQQGSDEEIWRRPNPSAPTSPMTGAPTAGDGSYAGPPRGMPAAPTWRPPMMIQVPAARAMPYQDDARLDEQEKSARTVTYGIGMVTGAIALLLLFVVCGRLVF